MNKKLLLSSFGIAGFASALIFTVNFAHANAQLKPCDESSTVGDSCQIEVLNLKPTQFSVGMIAVAKKMKKLESKTPKKLEKYLREHPIPVVKRTPVCDECDRDATCGAENNSARFYMVDHHHLSRALLEMNVANVRAEVVGEILDTDSGAEDLDSSFWWVMRQKNWVYLKDRTGSDRLPIDLPKNIANVADDPWRSLAGELEDLGDLCKSDGVYFFEFIWADFFRSRISENKIDTDFDAAVRSARALISSPAAKSLPGHCP